MRYVQGNDIYLNIFRMLIGRSVPGAEFSRLSRDGQLQFVNREDILQSI